MTTLPFFEGHIKSLLKIMWTSQARSYLHAYWKIAFVFLPTFLQSSNPTEMNIDILKTRPEPRSEFMTMLALFGWGYVALFSQERKMCGNHTHMQGPKSYICSLPMNFWKDTTEMFSLISVLFLSVGHIFHHSWPCFPPAFSLQEMTLSEMLGYLLIHICSLGWGT